MGVVRIALILSLPLILFLGVRFLRRPVSAVVTGVQLIAGDALPEHQGRTNFLVLGRGGGNHDGPNLTDTIIFVSIKLETGEATLISIPRDVWVPSNKARVNAAYQTGVEKESVSAGMILAKSAVSEIINQPIDFTVIIDFSAFTKAIDLMGGLDITVDRSFDDFRYPIPGKENDLCNGDPEYLCRYEHLHFDAGQQHMDGAIALKYVRSRHSLDPLEGNDYARSRRQEKVIAAVKSKITSVENLKDSQLYRDLFSLAQESVITDIDPRYYSTLFRLGLKVRKQPFKHHALIEPDHLYNPPLSPKYNNAWVLLPKNNDPQVVYSFVSSLLQ